MTFPQARILDVHVCSLTLGAPMPVTGPCAPTVLVSNLPAARITDICAGILPPGAHPIAKGSMTVLIGSLPAARLGVDPCAGGGAIVMGAFTVLTGG
ncbi:PAAR domain-containing protein [Pseudogemmobacter humi]|uniref:PAAR motif protein n=1 Tax=Pseudogemmobacter humi TaxID=2483812 RepID=A0A3P5XX83_9RHOB|nr:PAAR domain-containing protein [Pseudogemmobacter humi]VDC32778.1 PAAR motif protein [Pseudogemmobacter humi]